MAQYPSKKTIITAIDLDTDESRLADDKAKFIKGLTLYGGQNPLTQNKEGDNAGVWIPGRGSKFLIGNPVFTGFGNNYSIGTFYAKETSELYCFIYNTRSEHLIYRVNSDNTTQIVYRGADLNFQFDERYYIGMTKCVLRVQKYIAFDGTTQERKFLLFTDGFNDQRCISVEDSIATSSFTTAFFRKNGYECQREYLINLGVAHSMRCIGISQIQRTDAEKSKQNLTVNKGWQFRIKYIDVFGRPSEHGIISNRYYTIIGSNCTATNNSLPRCYKLVIDLGCPLVRKIQIEFRTTGDEQWFLYDTIDKYDECEDKPWYQLDINSSLDYDPQENTFNYTFCGDKECQPIDETETSRLFNPLPLTSFAMMAINRGIALTNNTRGFEPFDCNQLSKLSYTVTPPTGGCETSLLRTVTIYVPIYSPLTTNFGYLWEYDMDNATIFWGQGTFTESPQKFGQYFVPGNYGFIGYMAGTKYLNMSQQVELDMTTKAENDIGITKYPLTAPIGPSAPSVQNNRPYQKFQFKLPPGEYSFRIASPLVLQSEGYQTTSTNVFGKVKMDQSMTVVNDDKELIINCCEGDVTLIGDDDETLVIYDCSFGPNTSGYLREAEDTVVPFEYCPVGDLTAGNAFFSAHTDHNGFFFGVGTGRYIALYLQASVCVAPGIINIQTRFSYDLYELRNYALYKGDTNGDPYPAQGRRLIKGNVKLCEGDIGVGGSLVVAKGAQFINTNSLGDFTLILHQRPDDWPGDLIFLSQSGGCRITSCDNQCTFCFTDQIVAYKPCGESNRDTTINPWTVNIVGNVKGLKNGSRRGIGITIHDWMGRCTPIQIVDSQYIDIPSIIDTHQFDFSVVTWTMQSGIVFPSWAKYITFWITDNLNYDKSLMWVADNIQYIDNGGNINTVAPTKVRVYWESLLEYQKQNNYGVNTEWQISVADASGNVNSVVGDYVQFIKNGDYTWFDKTITALVTYDKDAKYFDLEYTEELANLKAGALFELIRPKQCQTDQIFYETCSTVRITDGKPEVFSGTLQGYDSYFLNRQIPIPQEQTDSKGNVVRTVITQYFSFFFEYDSPSDFWGKNLANKGRINVKNPYQRKVFQISETALSKALVDRSNFFGLSYYDDNDTATFEEQEWGEIVATIISNNQVLYVCEHNNFTVGFNDDIVRVGVSGNIISGSTDDKFGKPQHKIGNDYGCQKEDINSLQAYNGMVWYLDRDKNALIQHNFSLGTEISMLGYKSYLTRKIMAVEANNNSESPAFKYIFIGGISPNTGEYYLTVYNKPLSNSSVQLYTNIELDHSLQIRETIAINMADGTLRSFPIFVPEYYGYMDGNVNGKGTFTFRGGLTWTHRILDESYPYNNYFGIQGPKVLTVVTNLDAEKVKRYMYAEVYTSQHKMIVDLAVTENGQVSRIPGIYWKFAEKFWMAPYLRNVNTFADPNVPILASAPLTEGDVLSGRWIKTRFVSEDVDKGKYCEISAITTFVIPVEKSGAQ